MYPASFFSRLVPHESHLSVCLDQGEVVGSGERVVDALATVLRAVAELKLDPLRMVVELSSLLFPYFLIWQRICLFLTRTPLYSTPGSTSRSMVPRVMMVSLATRRSITVRSLKGKSREE